MAHRLTLARDEQVLATHRRHWKELLIWPVAFVLLLPLGFWIRDAVDSRLGDLAVGAAMFVALVAIVVLVVDWWVDRFIVTDQRVVDMTGFFGRTAQSIPVTSIDNVDLHVSAIGRALGFGRITIESSGFRGVMELLDVDRPFQLQRSIFAARDAAAKMQHTVVVDLRGGHKTEAPASVDHDLERLIRLHEKGELSDSEFERFRQRM